MDENTNIKILLAKADEYFKKGDIVNTFKYLNYAYEMNKNDIFVLNKAASLYFLLELNNISLSFCDKIGFLPTPKKDSPEYFDFITIKANTLILMAKNCFLLNDFNRFQEIENLIKEIDKRLINEELMDQIDDYIELTEEESFYFQDGENEEKESLKKELNDLANKKQYDKLEKLLLQRMSDHPKQPNLHAYLIWLYKTKNQDEIAIEHVKKMILDPDLKNQGLLYLLDFALEKKEIQLIEPYFIELERTDFRDDELFKLIEMFKMARMHKYVNIFCKKYLKKYPYDYMANFLYALSFYFQGQIKEARYHLKNLEVMFFKATLPKIFFRAVSERIKLDYNTFLPEVYLKDLKEKLIKFTNGEEKIDVFFTNVYYQRMLALFEDTSTYGEAQKLFSVLKNYLENEKVAFFYSDVLTTFSIILPKEIKIAIIKQILDAKITFDFYLLHDYTRFKFDPNEISFKNIMIESGFQFFIILHVSSLCVSMLSADKKKCYEFCKNFDNKVSQILEKNQEYVSHVSIFDLVSEKDETAERYRKMAEEINTTFSEPDYITFIFYIMNQNKLKRAEAIKKISDLLGLTPQKIKKCIETYKNIVDFEI